MGIASKFECKKHFKRLSMYGMVQFISPSSLTLLDSSVSVDITSFSSVNSYRKEKKNGVLLFQLFKCLQEATHICSVLYYRLR